MTKPQRELLAKLQAIHLKPYNAEDTNATVESNLQDALLRRGFKVISEREVPNYTVIHDLVYKLTSFGAKHVLATFLLTSTRSMGDRFLTPLDTWDCNATEATINLSCEKVAIQLLQDFRAVASPTP
ncbi:hypothetical protein [Corallococcus caeni]|uniref:hypothetical protein n=1 Tax=Corallococcus caeni TaxID=3082388 RepID=UPI0030C77387